MEPIKRQGESRGSSLKFIYTINLMICLEKLFRSETYEFRQNKKKGNENS